MMTADRVAHVCACGSEWFVTLRRYNGEASLVASLPPMIQCAHCAQRYQYVDGAWRNTNYPKATT